MIGGVPAGGLDFGAAINTQAIIDQPYQFDFYDGGGLDVAFLGLAQAIARAISTSAGSARKLAGAGGFINISQNAKKVVFVGTFTAGGQTRCPVRRASCASARRRRRASSSRRWSTARSAARIAASAASACSTSPSAACLRSRADGLELIEIAPGIDLERDILAQMDFRPLDRAAIPS